MIRLGESPGSLTPLPSASGCPLARPTEGGRLPHCSVLNGERFMSEEVRGIFSRRLPVLVDSLLRKDSASARQLLQSVVVRWSPGVANRCRRDRT